jgi:hypothetical protein
MENAPHDETGKRPHTIKQKRPDIRGEEGWILFMGGECGKRNKKGQKEPHLPRRVDEQLLPSLNE